LIALAKVGPEAVGFDVPVPFAIRHALLRSECLKDVLPFIYLPSLTLPSIR